MDSEDRKLLDKTFKLVKDNHMMLRKVRSYQKKEAIFKFIKFIVVIGLGVGALYYLQPYIDKIQQLTSQLNSLISGLGDFLPK